MSRLLTTLLLYRNGFYVGKYISLEAKIANAKDLYYDALARSQDRWHEGCENAVPFIKYLLSTFLAAYKDFEDRFSIVETKLPAVEMVRKATQNKIGKFTKQDIRELCPSLSISSIEGSLRKLVKEGDLKREGSRKGNLLYSPAVNIFTINLFQKLSKREGQDHPAFPFCIYVNNYLLLTPLHKRFPSLPFRCDNVPVRR